jgi:hypothetical protein
MPTDNLSKDGKFINRKRKRTQKKTGKYIYKHITIYTFITSLNQPELYGKSLSGKSDISNAFQALLAHTSDTQPHDYMAQTVYVSYPPNISHKAAHHSAQDSSPLG